MSQFGFAVSCCLVRHEAVSLQRTTRCGFTSEPWGAGMSRNWKIAAGSFAFLIVVAAVGSYIYDRVNVGIPAFYAWRAVSGEFRGGHRANVNALHIKQTDVVGWSDGGIIGLDMAIKHPERVRRLITIGANYDVNGLDPKAMSGFTRTRPRAR
jgi:hypothetical protein